MSLPFDRLHFGIDPLGNGVGRMQPKVGQDPLQMIVEHLGHLDHRLQSAVHGPEVPALEEAPRPLEKDEPHIRRKFSFSAWVRPGLQIILAAVKEALHATLMQVLGMIQPVVIGLVQQIAPAPCAQRPPA